MNTQHQRRPIPWWRWIAYGFIILLGLPLAFALRLAYLTPINTPPEPALTNRPYPATAALQFLSTEDGVRVGGWHFQSVGNTALIIMIHGYGYHSGQMGRRWRDFFPHNGDLFLLDLRNHGVSQGARTTFGHDETRDVAAAAAFFRARYATIIAWGMSMGAAAAVRAATIESLIDGLILEGLYDSLAAAIERMATSRYIPAYPVVRPGLLFYETVTGVSMADMDMTTALSTIGWTPALLVHARQDQEVPMAAFERLAAAAGPCHHTLLLENGRHETIYSDNRRRFQQAVAAFIRRVDRHRRTSAAVRGCPG